MGLEVAVCYDIVIVGAGPAGLSFACLASEHGLKIALIDQQGEELLAAPPSDGRDIALTHRSIQILKKIGAWSNIAVEDIAAIKRACVKNADQSYVLNFDHDRTGRTALGYLVSNHIIRAALYRAAKTRENVEFVTGATAMDLKLGPSIATVSLSSGEMLEAPLVVAADSRFSEMRRKAGIGAEMRDFGHVCIVCRMKHEKPHGGTAYEWFDTDKTLAVLPLNNNESSIVITQPTGSAARAMDIPGGEYAADVERRFAGQWGAMELSGERHAYPLVATYADSFCTRRFALIGDAAVGMHPVTAHGFNFGLRGADTLAAKVTAAAQAALDIGAVSVLEGYDREHRKATYPLYIATNALVRLFTNNHAVARIARSLVLLVGSGLSPIKDYMLHKLTEVDEKHSSI
jgi:ubiquinone biosynthesis UbiH/UbiF/VisC/COQ6 family hydroxylase